MLSTRFSSLALLLMANIFMPFYLNAMANFNNDSSQMQAQGLPNGMPQLTEEQMLEFQKTIDAEIQQALEKMSAEERVQFDEMVEKISKMDEQELEEFVTQMFEEEEAGSLPKQATEPELPVVEEAPSILEKPAVPVISDKQEKALALLDALIKQINVFNQKATQTSELSAKIERWKIRKKIDWQSTWESMKIDINVLLQKLHKLRDSSIVSHEYKYINDFIADEQLYKSLNQLLEVLNQQGPQIKIPEFEAEKMNSATNEALRKVLNGFNHALYGAKILPALDKVFEKYEPTAKKLKDEEERIAKKSREESAKPRKSASIRTAGKFEPEEPLYQPGAGPTYDYDHAPTRGYSAPSYPSYTPPSESTKAPESGAGQKAAGSGKSVQSFSPEGKPTGEKGEKEEKSAGENKEKGKEKEGAGPQQGPGKKETKEPAYEAQTKDKSEDRAIARSISTIAGDLEAVTDLLKKNDTIKTLSTHLIENKPVDTELENNIPKIIETLTAALDGIKTLQRKAKSFNAARRKHFQQELGTALEDSKKVFTMLGEQLKIVENSSIENKNKISEAKKAAYLGEEYLTPLEAELKKLAYAFQTGDQTTINNAYESVLAKAPDESFKQQLQTLNQAIGSQDKDAIETSAKAIDQAVEDYKKTAPAKTAAKTKVAKPSLYDVLGLVKELEKSIKGFAS